MTLEENKLKFINLLKQVNRPGIENLIEFLQSDQTDFFIAPASSKYHLAREGGLCEHSLNVYENLKMLCDCKDITISNDSIIICALLHDMSKSNFYRKDFRNKKVYCDNGSKSDNNGRFEWISEPCYTIREDAFIFGNHEQNSEFLIRCFIPLNIDESIAILHHMGSMAADCAKDNIAAVYNKYSLTLLLHLADMLATYVDES